MGDPSNTIWLRTACAQNGLLLADDQLAQLDEFASKLLEWNKKINLISRRDAENIWSAHILHSLSVLFKLEIPPGLAVLDLGTGGGLPGVPIRIVRPDLAITLLDSTQKKTNVVKDILHTLNLTGVDVVWARAEDLGRQDGYKHRFDIVLARAVASLRDLLRWSFPLLKQTQVTTRSPSNTTPPTAKRMVAKPSLIAFKGGNLESEVRQLKNDERVNTISTIDLSLVGSNQFEVGEKKIVLVEVGDGHKEKAG